ncbi:MAG: hypothetical protein GY898_05650 [Proteobacteria bacterium]|nr:hypothetical protein [Pseudomonadota bacterium]
MKKQQAALYAFAVALPFILFYGVALVLPPKFENHSEGDVQAPADLVFDLLTTTDGLGEWTLWAADTVGGLTGAAAEGPTSGIGTTYAWSIDGMPWGTITVREAERPTRVLFMVDYGGRTIEREILLEAAGTTTTLDWSERHYVPKPLDRWLGLFMDEAIEDDINQSIAAIGDAAAVRWQTRSKVTP